MNDIDCFYNGKEKQNDIDLLRQNISAMGFAEKESSYFEVTKNFETNKFNFKKHFQCEFYIYKINKEIHIDCVFRSSLLLYFFENKKRLKHENIIDEIISTLEKCASIINDELKNLGRQA